MELKLSGLDVGIPTGYYGISLKYYSIANYSGHKQYRDYPEGERR